MFNESQIKTIQELSNYTQKNSLSNLIMECTSVNPAILSIINDQVQISEMDLMLMIGNPGFPKSFIISLLDKVEPQDIDFNISSSYLGVTLVDKLLEHEIVDDVTLLMLYGEYFNYEGYVCSKIRKIPVTGIIALQKFKCPKDFIDMILNEKDIEKMLVDEIVDNILEVQRDNIDMVKWFNLFNEFSGMNVMVKGILTKDQIDDIFKDAIKDAADDVNIEDVVVIESLSSIYQGYDVIKKEYHDYEVSAVQVIQAYHKVLTEQTGMNNKDCIHTANELAMSMFSSNPKMTYVEFINQKGRTEYMDDIILNVYKMINPDIIEE